MSEVALNSETEITSPGSGGNTQNETPEKVEWRVNEPEETQPSDEIKTTGDLVSKAQDSVKDEVFGKKQRDEKEEAKLKEPLQKRKYKFEGKEVELDSEQAERFVQKGLLHEKKNWELAKGQKDLEAKLAAAQNTEREAKNLIEAIKAKGLDALVALHGEEGLRDQMEKWLLPRIQREQLPQEQQQLLSLQERAERAEALIAEQKESYQQEQLQKESQSHIEQYTQTFIKAAELSGLPQDEVTLREMADLAIIARQSGVDYPAEKLAEMARGKALYRTQSLAAPLIAQITEAKQKQDYATVIKCGEKLEEMFGESVVYAMGKYLVAKMSHTPESVTTKVVDTAKAVQTNGAPKKRMTMDEYLQTTKKIARGEMEPPPGW